MKKSLFLIILSMSSVSRAMELIPDPKGFVDAPPELTTTTNDASSSSKTTGNSVSISNEPTNRPTSNVSCKTPRTNHLAPSKRRPLAPKRRGSEFVIPRFHPYYLKPTTPRPELFSKSMEEASSELNKKQIENWQKLENERKKELEQTV